MNTALINEPKDESEVDEKPGCCVEQGCSKSLAWGLVKKTLLFCLIAVVVVIFGLYLTAIVLSNDKCKRGNVSHVTKRPGWNSRTIPGGNGNRTIVRQMNLVIINETRSRQCMTMKNCTHYLRQVNSKYNFLVGGDGSITENLGWNIRNNSGNNSIEILFLGNYTINRVTYRQRVAVQDLLKRGIKLKRLAANYWLQAAHSQVANRTSLGINLLSEIKRWHHYHNGTLPNPSANKNIIIDKSDEHLVKALIQIANDIHRIINCN